MASGELMGKVCELMIALPGDSTDLYRRHQQVWQAVSPYLREGREFLYRMESARIARVRSAALPTGTISDLGRGPWRIALVAARIEERNKERPVPVEEIPAWTATLLAKHGFADADVTVEDHWIAVGEKPERVDRAGHLIRYAAAQVRFTARITNAALANKAWASGIGRGRRFGFGMPVSAQR